MTKKFKKGDRVIRVRRWNDVTQEQRNRAPDKTQVYVYQECEVLSWGAKQATLLDLATGTPIRDRIYTAHSSSEGVVENLEVARAWVGENVVDFIARLERRVSVRGQLGYGCEGIVAQMKAGLQRLRDGDVELVSLGEARVELVARINAEKKSV